MVPSSMRWLPSTLMAWIVPDVGRAATGRAEGRPRACWAHAGSVTTMDRQDAASKATRMLVKNLVSQ
jgi:hypothetical protein